MESSLRTLQENIQNKEKEFENLIFMKQRWILYSLTNDRVFNQVLNLIDPLDKGISSKLSSLYECYNLTFDCLLNNYYLVVCTLYLLETVVRIANIFIIIQVY
jgi:hypothetical protein